MVLLRIVLQLGDQLRCHTRLRIMLRLALIMAICAAIATPARAEIPICVREDAAPFSEKDENGAFQGYSVDLCRLVARELGEDVALVPVTAETRFDALRSGDCMMLCGATTVTMRRRNDFEFSLMTFVTDTAFLFPREMLNGISPNRASLSVGFLKNTTAHEYLRDGDVFDVESLRVDLRHMDSHEFAMQALKSGEIESYIADRDILHRMLQDLPALTQSHIVGTRGLTYEPYAIAMAKDAHELRGRVDQALARLFRDGVVWSLIEKHIPSRSNDPLLAALLKLQSIPE